MKLIDMPFRIILFFWNIFLIETTGICQSNSGAKCVLEFSIATNYQHNKFVNTDFTSINSFTYQNKVRLSASTGIHYNFSEKYSFVTGIRLQDAGWKRLDSSNTLEIHRKQSNLDFLYLSPSFGIERKIYQRKIFELTTSLGIDPEFKIYEMERIIFSDNSIEKVKPIVETVKFNTLFWFSVNSSFSLGDNFSAGLNYLVGINYQSFNKVVIANNPVLQSFELTFGIKFK
jgi:hypothetical protein